MINPDEVPKKVYKKTVGVEGIDYSQEVIEATIQEITNFRDRALEEGVMGMAVFLTHIRAYMLDYKELKYASEHPDG